MRLLPALVLVLLAQDNTTKPDDNPPRLVEDKPPKVEINAPVADEFYCIAVGKVMRSAWKSRRMQERRVIVYYHKSAKNNSEAVAWEEYSNRKGKLLSRAWCDGKDVLITDEVQKQAYKWPMADIDRLLIPLAFVQDSGAAFWKKNFTGSSSSHTTEYIHPGSPHIPKESAVNTYNPSYINLEKALISSDDQKEFRKNILFLREKVSPELFKAFTVKYAPYFLQVLPKIQKNLKDESLNQLSEAAKQKMGEVPEMINQLVADAEKVPEGQNFTLTNEMWSYFGRNEVASLLLLKKKLFELFSGRAKETDKETITKNRVEMFLEKIISLYDEAKVEWADLNPVENSRLQGNVLQVMSQRQMFRPLLTFYNHRWSYGSSTYHNKLYLSSYDLPAVMELVLGKVKNRDTEGLTVVERPDVPATAMDILEDFNRRLQYKLSYSKYTTEFKDGKVALIFDMITDFPEKTVLRNRIHRFGYVFNIFGRAASEQLFGRTKSEYRGSVKAEVATGSAKVDITGVQPGKYTFTTEYSYDEQSSPDIRKKLKGYYLEELASLTVIAPRAELFAKRVRDEYVALLKFLEKSRSEMTALMGLSADIGSAIKEADRILKTYDGFENQLKEFVTVLSSSSDLVQGQLSQFVNALKQIQRAKNEALVVEVLTGKKEEPKEPPKDVEMPAGGMYMPSANLPRLKEILDLLEPILVRETYLYFVESIKGMYDLGIDRGMLKDIRDAMKEVGHFVLGSTRYEANVKPFVTVMHLGAEYNFAADVDKLLSNDLIDESKAKAFMELLKAIEDKLRSGR